MIPGSLPAVSEESQTTEERLLHPDSTPPANPWAQRVYALERNRVPADRGRALPDFFVVGPPRTGTSWLHEVLKQRATLPTLAKETRFFDVHFHRGMAWYMAQYPHSSSGWRLGEVAPTYFASEQARFRIRELVPSAKIICVFRDPTERLISLYRLKRAYGWIPWTFEEAILSDPELTESSRYATHLKAWQRDFGVDQVLPTLFDDVRDDPQTYVNTVADFIGIPRFMLPSRDRQSIHASELMTLPRSYSRTRTARLIVEWLQARRFGRLVAVARKTPLQKLLLGGGPPFADPPTDLSLNLLELFRREVEELERMLQRDLSAWKPLSAALQTGQAA